MSIPKRVKLFVKDGILETTTGSVSKRFHNQEFALPDDDELLELIAKLRQWPTPWTLQYNAVNFVFMRTVKRQRVRVMDDGSLVVPDYCHIQKSNDEYEEHNALSTFREKCVITGQYDESEEPLRVSLGCPGLMCSHTAPVVTDPVIAQFKRFMGVYRGNGTLSTQQGANYLWIVASEKHGKSSDTRWLVQAWSDADQGGEPARMRETLACYEHYPSSFPKQSADWRPKVKVRDGMLCPNANFNRFRI